MLGLRGRVTVVMGTLSKALGSSGGFVAASGDLAELLRNRARTHMFDTALGPPAVGAARRALEVVREEPERRERVRRLARQLFEGLAGLGYDVREPAAAIVPLMVGEAGAAVRLSAGLLDRGVLAPAIRPPSVPAGTARLRLTVMATHTDRQVEQALEAFAALPPPARGRPSQGQRSRTGTIAERSSRSEEIAERSSRSEEIAERSSRSEEIAERSGRREALSTGKASSDETALYEHSRDRSGRSFAPDDLPRPFPPPETEALPLDGRVAAAGGVFVTGTDTGVGKTVVTAAIARVLRGLGMRVAVLKAVQTGTGDGRPGPHGAGDAAFAGAAAGLEPGLARAAYRLRAPLAPSVAARLEGVDLDVERIHEAFQRLRAEADVVVVEGAGGLLVPVTDDVTMGGLAAGLGLPAVVVVRPGLGTINHTCLTVAAARGLGLEVCGLVISGFPAEPGLVEATNPAALEQTTGVPLWGCVPVIAGLDVDAGHVGDGFDPVPWLGPPLGGRFDRAAFLASLPVPPVPPVLPVPPVPPVPKEAANSARQ